ncbi:unnamed protein product [Polarella glacialis]|uniref:Uncharacterized protein n=1 Tax=Polarella glacialis TaxID=89957 RepID=A0A813J3U5_POLGL|nr:unnamed protein product [Polarella glacialis]
MSLFAKAEPPVLVNELEAVVQDLAESLSRCSDVVKRSVWWRSMCEQGQSRSSASSCKAQRSVGRAQAAVVEAEAQSVVLQDELQRLVELRAASEPPRLQCENARQLYKVACAALVPAVASAAWQLLLALP